MRTALLIVVMLAGPAAVAAVPSTCGLEGPYQAALCAYQQREFPAAEQGFRDVMESRESGPEAIRARYFLARTLMKQGKFADAASMLTRIYSLDRSFYQSWSCDFLLGECRRALGR